jgi:HPt (histidine-containing phosphotransfer) domain-containing protein
VDEKPPIVAEGAPPAIDLAHLARQTMGDVALQREVLELFAEHAARVVAQIKQASKADPRREAAHALVGSARGIGAFGVARSASAIEAGVADSASGIAALEVEVEAARRFIAEHLSD